MEKSKFAFYWGASCGGCEIAVLDINEKILDLLKVAEIVLWPVALDYKYKDVEKMSDRFIDYTFFNGSVRNEEQEYLAHLLRKKSKTLIAFGSCACDGCIPGLANLFNKKEIFQKVYGQDFSNEEKNKTYPKTLSHRVEGDLTLPEFYDTVKTLNQIVEVDYYIPGCPPASETVANAFELIMNDILPERGSVLASSKDLCDECPRTFPSIRIHNLNRIHMVDRDPEKCFLEQGIICMGPSTRGGCGAQCINANMPCTGCYGPCPNVIDQGAKMISALSALLGDDAQDMSEFERLMHQIKDPIGTFYRYTLPRSVINRRV
ncbi:NADH-quinone oxidoreductase subunit B family protein [[Eubacterium] cellulosolvens]